MDGDVFCVFSSCSSSGHIDFPALFLYQRGVSAVTVECVQLGQS